MSEINLCDECKKEVLVFRNRDDDLNDKQFEKDFEVAKMFYKKISTVIKEFEGDKEKEVHCDVNASIWVNNNFFNFFDISRDV